MLEMGCELLEGGALHLTFDSGEGNYAEFNFDDLGDLEGFLMEVHEMAILGG